MSEQVATAISVGLALYFGAGVLFAIPFVIRGVDRIDEVARHSGWGFRLMILPGSIALWPILLRRWIGGAQPGEESNAHRLAARKSR
ncbi:MAG TPA: hypothetical protein VD788_04080 [Candidatus Polarisedimenticolaceae bacterium]|nr:hypothetical protein [Candidatus Polarisedimenticolaceae bacterium]